jgi:hypothetical protein
VQMREQNDHLHHAHTTRHRQWGTSNRRAIREASWIRPTNLVGSCLSFAYYATRPLKLLSYLGGGKGGPDMDKTHQAVWRMLNMPEGLHGRTDAPASAPTSLPTEAEAEEQFLELDKHVLSMRITTEGGWRHAWEVRESTYMSKMMTKDVAHYPSTKSERDHSSNVPSAIFHHQHDDASNAFDLYQLQMQNLRDADHPTYTSSQLSIKYRTEFGFTADADDGELLLADDSGSADVLIEFAYLRLLLREMFVYFRPGDMPLGVEEKDELLQEAFQWSRDNSRAFLQARFKHQPNKLAGFLGGGLGEAVGIAVPVSELRKWLRAKGEVIAHVHANNA